MSYILSPEQLIVTNTIYRTDESTVKYFDIDTALHSVIKGITALVKEGETILIHLPNNDTSSHVKSVLLQNSINDFMIEIDNDATIPETDTIKLRSTVKGKIDTQILIDNTLSNKKHSLLKAELQKTYKSYDEPVFNDVSFIDFAHNYIYRVNTPPRITIKVETDIEKWELDSVEYYLLKNEILKASKLYNKQYELYNHLNLIDNSVFDSSPTNNIESIASQVKTLKDKSNLLLNQYSKIKENLVFNAKNSIKSQIDELKNVLITQEDLCLSSSINDQYLKNEKEVKFNIFKKKKKTNNTQYLDSAQQILSKLKSINSKWAESNEHIISDDLDYNMISSFIDSINSQAVDFENELIKKALSDIHRINKINTKEQRIKLLATDLESLIEELKASNIFVKTFDQRILSFSKQHKQIKSIFEYLEHCSILFLKSADFTQWKMFYNNTSEQFKELLNELKNHDNSLWETLFEHWYYTQIVTKITSNNTLDFNKSSQLLNLENSIDQTDILAIIQKLYPGRISAAEELKSNNKELFHILFKKKQLPQTSWNSLVLMNRPFLKKFFPIHICTSLKYCNEYDTVISFSDDCKTNNDYKVHYISPIDVAQIDNEIGHLYLYLNTYNYNLNIGKLGNSIKLKAAKKLAKFILSLNQNIDIYQLKNANIISLLHGQDEFLLEQNLSEFYAKKIDTENTLYERLTESILITDRQPTLIIKDNLINTKQYQHLSWQYNIIEIFKTAGFKIISLNTTEQIENNSLAFSELISSLDLASTPASNEPMSKSITSEVNIDI
ncbi:MAG: hypothetical protein V3V14_11825 [Saprospiraceae bacterium]